MDEQQKQTTTASTDDTGPDDSEPTPERQAELRQAYEANIAVGKPPYAGIESSTRGEMNWIIRERRWVEPNNITRSEVGDLRDAAITGDMTGINLDFADLSGLTLPCINAGDARFFAAAYATAPRRL